ncbi:hypothetical protein RQP46_000081 [Phenoliferia psychrophenolica]
MATLLQSTVSLLLPPLALRLPLPPFYAALPTIILLLLSISPPSRLLTLALLPPLLWSALYVPLAFTTGNVGGDFGLGSQGIFYFLTWLDRFVITPDYERVFLRGSEGRPQKAWTLGRVWYATKLCVSMRGAGWRWEVRNTPPGPRETRWGFIKSRVGRAASLYLVVDALSTYQQRQPYFHRQIPFSALSSGDRLLCGASAALIGGAAIGLLYNLVVVVCVSSRLWTPEECPDLFGPVSESTTLSGFWGRTWHQSFRRVFTTPGLLLSNLLSLPPTSTPTRILTTLVAFSLSAIQHAFGMVAMARTGRGAALFFLSQPIGLAMEELATRGARMVGIGKNPQSWRAFGFMWTVTWLLATSPPFFDELVQAGMWTVDPAPFSIVKGVMYGQWWNP